MDVFLKKRVISFPPDSTGRSLSIWAIIIIVLIQLFRIKIDDVLLGAGLGFVPLLIVVSPFLCTGAALLVYYVVLMMKYSVTTHLLPGIILVAGLIIVFILVPPPRSYEERIFSKHQDDYRNLAQMAYDGELPVSFRCNGDGAYAYPNEYKYLENRDESCIYTYYQNVEFTPRNFYRLLLYVADPSELKYPGCYTDRWGEGWIYLRLDSNWFICQRDFN